MHLSALQHPAWLKLFGRSLSDGKASGPTSPAAPPPCQPFQQRSSAPFCKPIWRSRPASRALPMVAHYAICGGPTAHLHRQVSIGQATYSLPLHSYLQGTFCRELVRPNYRKGCQNWQPPNNCYVMKKFLFLWRHSTLTIRCATVR